MNTEIIAKEYGIEEQKATDLTKGLSPILQERESLIQEFQDVSTLEVNEENIPLFRELRLRVQKNRTQGINKWHKSSKEFFLAGGRFVDAIKNKENQVNEEMESKLMDAEKHFENLEKERVEKLNQDRIQAEKKAEAERLENERLDKLESERRFELAPYTQFVTENNDLRLMSNEDYKTLLNDLISAKKEYEAEQEKIRVENERLKKEREEAEKKRKEEEAKKEAEYQAQLKKEREAREKLEREEKARKDAEKAESDRKAKEEEEKRKEAERLAKAPIKEKLTKWVDSFELPETTVDNNVSKEIISKFEAFKKWSINQIKNL